MDHNPNFDQPARDYVRALAPELLEIASTLTDLAHRTSSRALTEDVIVLAMAYAAGVVSRAEARAAAVELVRARMEVEADVLSSRWRGLTD